VGEACINAFAKVYEACIRGHETVQRLEGKVDKAYNNIINNFTWNKSAEKVGSCFWRSSGRRQGRLGFHLEYQMGHSRYTRLDISGCNAIARYDSPLLTDEPGGVVPRMKGNAVRCWNMDSTESEVRYEEIRGVTFDIVHINITWLL
jgi:hypothetical protein